MLGGSLGYTLASICLRYYISPDLTPIITNKDSRWVGAYWLGWFLISFIVAIFAFLVSLFPRMLPRAHLRRAIGAVKRQFEELENTVKPLEEEDIKFLPTYKRVLMNKTIMMNNISSVFYIFGMLPFWMFMPKYIEIQYRQSAATSRLVC